MSLLFRRSNGFYYLVTYSNGHRVWRSTGKRRRAEAEKCLRDSLLQAEQSGALMIAPREMQMEIQRPQCISFSEFIPQWRVYANTSFMWSRRTIVCGQWLLILRVDNAILKEAAQGN